MRAKDDIKQEALFEATVKLVNEIGFAASSVSKIAGEAGISPATLYIYYKNKEDLLVSTYVEIKRNIAGAVHEGFDETLPIRDILRRVWFRMFDYISRHPDYFQYTEQFAHSPYQALVDKGEIEAFFDEQGVCKLIKPHPIVKEVCQNLPDVVRVLEAYFPNRLFFTDKAKRTAKEHNGQLDCSIVWDMLMDINDHLYPLLFEKSFKGPLETAFGQRSRFGLALKETDLTMSNAAMEREREDGYREETIVAWSHVTHGGGANTTRIHYWVDKERQLIVISAIVDHYTTSGTKRHGH